MAYKTSRRTRRTRRGRKRSFNMKRRKTTTRANTLRCKRFVFKRTLVGSDAGSSGAQAEIFALSDVANASEFTNLFEEYQIAGIAYRFVLDRDPNQSTGTFKGYSVHLAHAVDHTDSTAPSGFTEMYQYQRMKDEWLSESRMATRWYFMKPNTIDVGYTTGVISNYGVNYKRWIDCTNTSTPYYGLKYFYYGLFAGIGLNLQCRYYIKAKSVK